MNEECSMINAQSSKGNRRGTSRGASARWSGRGAAVAVAALCLVGAGSSAWGAISENFEGLTQTSFNTKQFNTYADGATVSLRTARYYATSGAAVGTKAANFSTKGGLVASNPTGIGSVSFYYRGWNTSVVSLRLIATCGGKSTSTTFSINNSTWYSTTWNPGLTGTGAATFSVTNYNNNYRFFIDEFTLSDKTASGVAPVWKTTIAAQNATLADGLEIDDMTEFLQTIGTPTPTITVVSVSPTPEGLYDDAGNAFVFYPDTGDAGKTFTFTFEARNATGWPQKAITVEVAGDYSTANGIGNGAVQVNGTWYYCGNSSMSSWCTGGAFENASLGALTSLALGGQAQTWGDSSPTTHTADMRWSIYPASGSASDWGTQMLAYLDNSGENGNARYQTGGGSYAAENLNSALANLAAGNYKLAVNFRQQTGADSWNNDNNGNANYKANFSVAAVVTAGSVSGAALTATHPGASSGYQSFTVSGLHLTGALTVTAPSGFAVCSTSGGTYGNTVTLTPSGTTLSSTTVYVKLAADTASGATNGNVTISGGGLSANVTVAVSGTVKPAAPGVTISAAGPDSITGTVTGLETGGTAGTVTLKRYNNTTDAGNDANGTAVLNGVTVTGASQSFTDSGLAGCSNYYYRAWQTKNGQTSAGTATPVLATTDFAAPTVTNVSAEVDGDAADITFQWGSVSGASGYKVQVASTNEFSAGTPAGWDSVTNVTLTGSAAVPSGWTTSGYAGPESDGLRIGSSSLGSLTSPTPEGLPGKRVRVVVDAKYYGTDGSTFRVSVGGGPSWESSGTNWDITLSATTTPYTNYVNVANDQTGVTFTFASIASKKRIYLAGIDISTEGEPTGGTIVAESGALGSGVLEWTAEGLEVGTSYWYRVQATSDRGCAEWSEPASYTADGTPAIGLLKADGTALASGGTLDFGSCPVYAGAVTNLLTVTNGGTGTLTLEAPGVVTGQGFSIEPALSSLTVAPGGTATFGVKFAPAAGHENYTKMALVSLTNNAGAVYTFTVSADVPKPHMQIDADSGNAALTNLLTTVGTPSPTVFITVSGTDLRSAVQVSLVAITGEADGTGAFELCRTVDGTYTSSLSIPATGTLGATTFYARLKGTATGTFGAKVQLTCTGTGQTLTRTVRGTVAALSDGLEFAGQWHMNPGDVWVTTNTTTRDMQFGNGNYYFTPATNLPANATYQFKEVWRENGNESWWGDNHTLYINGASDWREDTRNGDNNTLVTHLTQAGYYTLRGRKTGDGVKYVAMFTEAEPVEVTSVGDDSATQGTAVVTVRAGLSAALSASEHVYLRYKVGSGAFTLTEMTGSGTNYSATITGQGKDTRVEYYVLTSPHAYVTTDPDLCTLRGMKSGTTNFCYVTELLPPRNATATAGYEKVVLAWDKNAAGNNTMIVRYPGLTPEVVAPSDGTPYGDNAQVGDGAGRVVYVNGDTTGVTNTVGVAQGTGYTYVLYSVEGTGGASKYSAGVPVTATTLSLAQPTVSANASGTVTLGGANAGRGEIYVVARTTGSDGFAGTPSGALPTVGSTLCGGTVVYTNTTSTFGDSVIGCTTYYYQAWLKAADEDAWSAGRKTAGVEMSRPGTPTVTGVTTNTDGFALEWTEADRADGYRLSVWTTGETTVTNTDILDAETLELSGSYAVFSDKTASNSGHSGAVYAGNACKQNGAIQLNTGGTPARGLYTTTSGGKVKSIAVEWESLPTAGNGYTVYGNTSGFSGVTDSASGTSIGTLTRSTTSLTSDAGYTHLLFVPVGGTSKSLTITIEWETTAEGVDYVSGFGAEGGAVTNRQWITGLDPGTDYGYALWAIGATALCAGEPTTNTVHTGGTAKPNPPRLTLTSPDAGTIEVEVKRGNGDVYELWRFASAELAALATTPPVAASEGVVCLASGGTETGTFVVTNTGLTGCTRYWYRAWEVNDPTGTPLFSDAAEASQKTADVVAPTGLTVASTNAHGATLQWTPAAGAAGYDVEVWHYGMGWSEPKTVTYSFTTNNSAHYTVSGTAPSGAGATLASDEYVNCVDAGQTNIFTLTGWAGARITGVQMEMCSWENELEEDSGAGSFTMTAGGASVVSIPTSAFNTTNWYGAWSDAEWVEFTVPATTTVVGEGASVTMTLIGTEDSLLWNSVTLTYQVREAGGRVYDWENGGASGGSSVTVAVAGATATLTGLSEGTEYGWSVAALGGECEDWADGPDFETPEMVSAPAIEVPLSAGIGGLSGALTGAAGADGVWLYRFEDDGVAGAASMPSVLGGTRVTNVTAAGEGRWTFADTNLLGCKTYWYRAWLTDEIDGVAYTSPGSDVASGRTDMAEPEPKGTGAGYQMVISWTNVPGATNYVLQVSDKTNTWTSLSSGTERFKETFDAFTLVESTGISNRLDEYTTTAGWTGSYVYCSDAGGSAKMGKSSGGQGILTTPVIAGLASGDGNVSFDLMTYNNDATVVNVGIKYGSGDWTWPKSVTLETNWHSYSVAITNTESFQVQFKANAANSQRFHLDNVTVTENTGGSGERGMFYNQVAVSPVTIDGLEIGSNYFFRVTANGEECSTTGYGWAPTADAALLEVSPARKNFGTVDKNVTVSNKFTVWNRGNIDLTFAGVDTAPGGCGFAVTWPTGAAATANLAPGASREYWVAFTPTNSGAYEGTLRFLCNDANGAVVEGQSYKLVAVPLTGTGYDPETADPVVYKVEVTDGLGIAGTVADHSLALEADAPVLKVTAWHAKGILTNAPTMNTNATWTLRGPDGNVATLADGTELKNRRFSSVRQAAYGNDTDCAEFSVAIPALGAGRAAAGDYSLEITVTSTNGCATTVTNSMPTTSSVAFDDFTRGDVVADGSGKLGRGWTVIASGGATASEAAIHDRALELYGELGTSSGAEGRIGVVRDMSDVGYATRLHDFAGSGSWGFHFRSEAQLYGWGGTSMVGAFVLGSTQPGWLTADAGQAGLAVTLTTNGVQLASFTNSLLKNTNNLTWLGTAWTNGTAGKTLAVRVEFTAGHDALDAEESDDGEAHAAVPAKLALYVKAVEGTGGNPTAECGPDALVCTVEVPAALAAAALPYGGVLWAHGEGAAGAATSARFDDIYVPRMNGQAVPATFHCVDEDTEAPVFEGFNVPAAIAASAAAASGVPVSGTILDASGIWLDVSGTNAPSWETAAVAGPRWELWVDGESVASGAIATNVPAGNGAGTEVASSFTIPASAFDSAWRTTNCVVAVKAWDYDIDRAGDSLEGEARYRFTLCDATPTPPAWATVEADGAETAVLRWAWTNGANYVVVRSDAEIGEDATPPQGANAAPVAGTNYTGLGEVVYAGTGDNHLTNGWTAREIIVKPGSSNYFAVYGMTGSAGTGHYFSSPTRPKAYTWTTTNAAGEYVTHWATEGDAEGGKPAAGSVASNAWPCVTAAYEPGEGVDAFAYRTSVSYPTNGMPRSPAELSLAYGFESRTGTGSGWDTNAPTGWQGDTNKWKIHDGSLLTGKTGYPTPTGNKLYWQDTSSGSLDEAKLTRRLDAPESGDFFVAAVLNYNEPYHDTPATNKWIEIALVDEDGNDIASFGKPRWNSYNAAIEYNGGQYGGFTQYTLNSGHGNDYILVGQLSRTDSKFRMWVYWGATNSTDKIPEVYSKQSNNVEVSSSVTTTALNSVRADCNFVGTPADVAGIQLRAGSESGKELGHVYFDELRFASTWEELFLFNEPEVETFDLSKPAGSGKENGTNSVGLTQWLVSDGALAHGEVGLNATFELYHRTGIQSASFDILSGGSQGQTNLLRAATNGTTAAVGNDAASVVLEGTRGSVYGEWTTPDGGATGVAIPTNWISLESNYVLQVSLHSTGGREATATSSKDNMGGGATDLFFGEYGEGAGNDKYVEIYNGTGRDVDLYNYWIVRPQNALRTNNGVIETNDFSVSYTNLYLNSAAVAYTRLSSNSYVLHHKQTVVLLNNVNNTNHTPRLNKLKEQLDARRAKYIVMPYNVLDSNGSVPYLLVKAEDFDETAVSNAFKNHTRVNLKWLDACGCADGIGATERYIMSRKTTAMHLPRSNPMIIDTNEWDYRRWSFPKTGAGAVDDYATVPPYTNFVATAGGYDRAIGLGGTMEFRVYDDDEEPPALAGGGQGGGLRLKAVSGDSNPPYKASASGERTYVAGGWSFTNSPASASEVDTLEEYQAVTAMWTNGLTTCGGVSWSPLLGGTDLAGYAAVVKPGNGKGQSHVEFDGIKQIQQGALYAQADSDVFGPSTEVWLGFDLDMQDLAEPMLSFGYSGGTNGFINGRVEWSATGVEGSFKSEDGWAFAPYTGAGTTWADWSRSLDGVLPEGAGHVWFRVVLWNYYRSKGSFWLDNIRVEGNPRAVRVTDAELADRGVVFEVRVKDESGVDAGTAGTNTASGAKFDTGLKDPMYRRTPGATNLVETVGEKTVTNEYVNIQWTLADGAAEKSGGFGKQTAQDWYAATEAGAVQLKVEVGDLDDDRAGDQAVGTKNFGMLVVEDDDDEAPQIRMTTMKPRLDGTVAEWLFTEAAWAATDEMDGVAAGSLGLCTTAGTVSQPRATVRGTNETGKAVKTYAVYQSGWQAESKYWTTTLRTTGGGKGTVTDISFWSKVGSVNAPTGWELWLREGEEEAYQVTAGAGSLLTNGTAWVKEGVTNAEEVAAGTTIGVWREYGIHLGAADAIVLPADGTPVEVRLLGKGASPKGISAGWFLWDLKMEGELEQGTAAGDEEYTYLTDHDVAAGGEGVSMKGSVWDEGSGLGAVPTWEMTEGITGSGPVTFDVPETALTNRVDQASGKFTTTLPVSTTYTELKLKEYKGTITATDADHDREDSSGNNVDTMTLTGKFGFTVVDQDVTRPTAPTNVAVNGVAVPGTAPERTNVTWTNKQEFVVSFEVAVDQDPTNHWTDTAWTNRNVVGKVSNTNIQHGVSGIGEYRVSLTTNTAEGTAYSVAVTNGALANYGFERFSGDIGWILAPTNAIGITNSVAHEGTNSMSIGASTTVAARDRYARQVIACEMNGATTVTVGGTMWFYQNGSTSKARIYLEAFSDEAMTTALPCSGGLDQSFGSDDGKDIWTLATVEPRTFTATEGTERVYLRVTLYSSGAACYFDDVRLGVRVGAAPAAGTADRASMRFVADKASQGLNAKYLYAVDADNDREDDRLAGGSAMFYTAYDITPPTAVPVNHGEGASTEHLEDPTTQMHLTWNASGVGPDDPGHTNHPTGTGTDVLSPWATYKVYYTPYDANATTNKTDAQMPGYIYDTFLAPGATGDSLGQGRYTGWSNAWATKTVEDATAPADPYAAMTNRGTNAVTLYDLENDQEYLFVVVGVDKAGNEGPATTNSWVTNNTIKFELKKGWRLAKDDASVPAAWTEGMTNQDRMMSALAWTASGGSYDTNLVFSGEVKKAYDLLYWDARSFWERPENPWNRIGDSVQTNWFVDDGGPRRRGDIRFYRASYKDRWQRFRTVDGVLTTNAQTPLVSAEVYAQTAIPLRSGPKTTNTYVNQEEGNQNFVALHGVPYTNTFRAVFGGLETFPGGKTSAEATCIDFYKPGTNAIAWESYFLKEDGEWYRDGVETPCSDDFQERDFFTRAFSINLPYPIPTNYVAGIVTNWHGKTPVEVPYMLWKPILQVPTNGFSQSIMRGTQTAPVYNIVALRLPVAAHPSQMNLVTPVTGSTNMATEGLYIGHSRVADQIYTIDPITREPGQACYCRWEVSHVDSVQNGVTNTVAETNLVWRFVSGDGLVPAGYFKPNDVLVIRSRNGGDDEDEGERTWTWTYHPTNFYTVPNRHMQDKKE